MNILIIDDNCIVRELLTSLLNCNGHKVISAENGREAMQKAELECDQLDAVITDYNMPIMNGIEFLKCFKIKWPSIPVIVATGSTIDEQVWNNLGAHRVIYKPIASDILLPLLQNLQNRKPCPPFDENIHKKPSAQTL